MTFSARQPNADEKLAQLHARRIQTLTRLQDELKSQGHEVKMGAGDTSIIKVDGVYVNVQVTYEESGEYKFRTYYTGKLRLKLYGDDHKTKNYPEPKLGFDITKTVERILDVVNANKLRERNKNIAGKKAKLAKATYDKACEAIGCPSTYQFDKEMWSQKQNIGIRIYTPEQVQVRFNVSSDKMDKVQAFIASLEV